MSTHHENRLGVDTLKWELEDLSFRYLDEMDTSRLLRIADGEKTGSATSRNW